jgi:hypothetical protein
VSACVGAARGARARRAHRPFLPAVAMPRANFETDDAEAIRGRCEDGRRCERLRGRRATRRRRAPPVSCVCVSVFGPYSSTRATHPAALGGGALAGPSATPLGLGPGKTGPRGRASGSRAVPQSNGDSTAQQARLPARSRRLAALHPAPPSRGPPPRVTTRRPAARA